MPSNPLPLMTPAERLRAHLRVFFVDHGIFRSLFYANFHRVSPRAFRSAQPSPRQLRRWQRRHGIRTVLNIRGSGWHEAHVRLEAEVCDALGVHLESVHGFGSRDLPTREDLNKLPALFERLEYPVLFHCKSGADRAGFLSVLYLHLREGVPLEEARRQLRLLPFGHIKHANTGILDFFFQSYLAYAARHPGTDFLTWVNTAYEREALLRAFRPWYSLNWVTDKLLRRE
ncbi:MAG: tyrosine-protein phosphatase [Pseudomonadota bacterium]|uniref:tyrosine-protein phosphatase n=1 Tax=Thermithiobacillus tepidarius TaxID=929 RepID=UPI0003F813C8|nr:tyrosine-protein phosphatase [Thermithiobacillus tepidarius]